jgi:hypothetical protein
MDDLDFAESLNAKSDQLNADNLAGGPITVQITGARVARSEDQPLSLRLSGGHMPWKPCKGMRRLLAEAAGSTSARPWVGKWIRLYRDPRVKWAGKESGGIRVSGIDASILGSTRDFRVRDTRSSHTVYRVEPISERRNEGAPTASLDALLDEAGIGFDAVDRWLSSVGKPTLAEGTDESRATLAAWLAADPARLQRIRDLDDDEHTPADTARGEGL